VRRTSRWAKWSEALDCSVLKCKTSNLEEEP
jgi:hypothetical protein